MMVSFPPLKLKGFYHTLSEKGSSATEKVLRSIRATRPREDVIVPMGVGSARVQRDHRCMARLAVLVLAA
jgi:hypothetical protein